MKMGPNKNNFWGLLVIGQLFSDLVGHGKDSWPYRHTYTACCVWACHKACVANVSVQGEVMHYLGPSGKPDNPAGVAYKVCGMCLQLWRCLPGGGGTVARVWKHLIAHIETPVNNSLLPQS